MTHIILGITLFSLFAGGIVQVRYFIWPAICFVIGTVSLAFAMVHNLGEEPGIPNFLDVAAYRINQFLGNLRNKVGYLLRTDPATAAWRANATQEALSDQFRDEGF